MVKQFLFAEYDIDTKLFSSKVVKIFVEDHLIKKRKYMSLMSKVID